MQTNRVLLMGCCLQGMPRLERMAPPARPLPAEALALIGRGSGASGALPMPTAGDSGPSGLPPLHSNTSTPTSSRGGSQPFRAHALESPGSRSELSIDVPILQLPGSSPGGNSTSEQLTLARVPTEELGEGLMTQHSMASASSLGTVDLQMTIEPDAAPAAGEWTTQRGPAGGGARDENAAGLQPSSTAQREPSPDRRPDSSTAVADPLGATSNVGVHGAAASPVRPPQLAFSSSLGPSPTLATPPGEASSAAGRLPALDVPALASARLAAEECTGAEFTPMQPSWEAATGRNPGEAAFAGGRQLTRELSELAYVDRDPLDGSPTRRFRPTTDAEAGPEQAAALDATHESQPEAASLEQLLSGPSQDTVLSLEPATAVVPAGEDREGETSRSSAPQGEDLFEGVEKELSAPFMDAGVGGLVAGGALEGTDRNNSAESPRDADRLTL